MDTPSPEFEMSVYTTLARLKFIEAVTLSPADIRISFDGCLSGVPALPVFMDDGFIVMSDPVAAPVECSGITFSCGDCECWVPLEPSLRLKAGDTFSAEFSVNKLRSDRLS